MKRVVLVSFGLIFAAGYAGCLPADSGGTTGTAGHQGTAGTTGPGTAGTQGGTAGDNGTAGTQGGTAGDNGTAGTQGGTAGDNGTAGTQGGTAGDNGTAGTQGGTAGSTGGSIPTGRGGTTGTGGGAAGRGGTTGTAGTGGSSRGGTTGTAGTGGSSRGGTTGTAGTTGVAGTTGTGGGTGGNITALVGGPLDGQMFLGPCMQNTEASVCATVAGNCPNTGAADIPLRGVLTTDKTVTLGGTAGVTYTIVIHVQGEVESKNYTGGSDQSTTGSSPNLDGWRVGGTPNTGNAYNVYMLRVTNPGATTHTDYFLNSLDPPGIEDHTTYGINYTTPTSGALAFTAQGGASVRIVAADSNCSMIKNCGPNRSGTTCLAPIIMTGIEATAISKNPSFNFNTAYNGQWVVMTVKSVTQN